MKKFNNQSGFTMIEMLIVIVIISTLLLIAVPNMSKSNEVVNTKSCDVTKKLIEAQVLAYKVENDGELPASLEELEGVYIDKAECPDKVQLELSEDGEVVEAGGDDQAGS